MQDERSETADNRLRTVLRGARPEPDLPSRFEESVWRRIERQETIESEPVGSAWLELLVARILRPRLAMAGIVVILVTGGVLGAMDGTVSARDAARDRYVASVAPVPVR